jgi:catechol 2,3-dioxygenase-like lactoylglutathione lyase family enzyme
MSKLFGPIRQVGHVVSDINRTMQYWTETLGIGPFYVMPEIPFANFHYRGRPSPSPIVTLAFAQSGDLQIELIQQHNDAPSAYREFLSAGREGMQHVSSWFDDRMAYDRTRKAMIEAGMTIVHESMTEDGMPRFIYFETGRPDAPLVELSEALLPEVRMVPDIVAAEAVNWDGQNPVRYFPSLPESS